MWLSGFADQVSSLFLISPNSRLSHVIGLSRPLWHVNYYFYFIFSDCFGCSRTLKKSLQSLRGTTGKTDMIDILEDQVLEQTARMMIFMTTVGVRHDLEERQTHVGKQSVF